MKFYVWTDRISFLATAHAGNVAEARSMLLHGSLGKSGDGSCPERDKARALISSVTPNIYYGPTEEFVLTDSAALRESETEGQRLRDEVSRLTAQVEHYDEMAEELAELRRKLEALRAAHVQTLERLHVYDSEGFADAEALS